MIFPADEFKNVIGMVHNGKIENLTVTGMTIERLNDTVELNLVMLEGSHVKVDVETWQRGIGQVRAYMSDSTVKYFHIRAQAAESVELEFIAKDIPGCGFATIWLRKNTGPSAKPVKLGKLGSFLLPVASRLSQVKAFQHLLVSRQTKSVKPPYRLENEYFLLEASSKDGSLNLEVKQDGITYINLNRFLDGADCGDEYNFSPPEQDKILPVSVLNHVSMEKTPFKQMMILELEMSLPRSLTPDRTGRSSDCVIVPIKTQITLTKGIPRVDIQTEIENTAQDHRLRVHFPATFQVDDAWYDGHFEIIKRPIGLPAWDETWAEEPRSEKPQRAFTALKGKKNGLMIANRGLPEVEVLQTPGGQSEIALTLLRCVGWLSRDDFSTRNSHAGPFLPTPGAQLPGKLTFDYSIIPFSSQIEAFQTACQQAYAFNVPLRTFPTELHTGDIPTSLSLIEIDSPAFQISSIKTSEIQHYHGKSAWIVRGYNTLNETLQVSLKPWRKAERADLVNMAEQPQKEIELSEDGSVILSIKPHQVVSVQFTHQNVPELMEKET